MEQSSLCSLQHDVIQKSANEQIVLLKEVVINTGRVAEILEIYRTDQKDLVNIIAGKKQVPLSIFYSVVFSLVLILIMIVADGKWSDVNIGTSGVHIKQTLNDINTGMFEPAFGDENAVSSVSSSATTQ